MRSETGIFVDTLRFVDVMRAKWQHIAVCVLFAATLAVVYLILAPRWYTSTLAIMPADAGQSRLIGSVSALAGDMGISLPGAWAPDADKIAKVLGSRSVADAVIEKFDLIRRYQRFSWREPYLEDTRDELWDHCTTKIDRKSGTVALKCEDQDPALARDMTAYMGEVANDVFRRITAGAAREQRRFLEKRVADVRDDLEAAARKLREFQERHKVINLEAQGQAVVAQMAKLKGDLIAKQMQLDYLRTFSASDESTAVRLRKQIAIEAKELRALEAGRVASAPDVFPATDDVPALRSQLEELYREQKIQETLFLLLTQQFETAKLHEARDASQFRILDRPTVAMRPARPRAAIVLPVAVLFGLFVGISWVVIRERRRGGV